MIERTTGMLGVRSAAGTARGRRMLLAVKRFAAFSRSMQPMHPSNAFCRSRRLGTTFRSPVTTACRHCGVSAPGLSLRFHARNDPNPFDRRLSAQFGFEAETGRIHNQRPVIRAIIQRSHEDRPNPLPFRPFRPSGSKRSSGSFTRNPPYLTSDFSSTSTHRAFLSIALWVKARTPLRPARLSFRKPWN